MQSPVSVRFHSGPEKVSDAFVQSQVRFDRVPEMVPEKVWEALVQSRVKFNRVPQKVLEKVPGGFGAEPGQVPQLSGEGLRCFGAAMVKFNSVSEKVPEKVWEALVQSQVRFNRVPEEVLEKVSGGFGAEPSQVQQHSGVPEKVPEKVWEAPSSTGFAAIDSRKPSWCVSGAWLQSTFQKYLS